MTQIEWQLFLITRAPRLAPHPVKPRGDGEVWEEEFLSRAKRTFIHQNFQIMLYGKKLYEAIILWKQTSWLNLPNSCLMRSYWSFCWPSPKSVRSCQIFSSTELFIQTEFGNKFQILRGLQFCLLCSMASWCLSSHDSSVKITQSTEMAWHRNSIVSFLHLTPNLLTSSLFTVSDILRVLIFTPSLYYIIYINAGDSRLDKPLGWDQTFSEEQIKCLHFDYMFCC